MIICPFPDEVTASPSSGLTEREYFDVARGMAGVSGAWFIQPDRDDRGEVSVSILSDDDAALDLVFLMWREEGRLRLDCAQGEFYAELGVQEHTRAAIDAIRTVVEGGAAVKDRMDEIRFPDAH